MPETTRQHQHADARAASAGAPVRCSVCRETLETPLVCFSCNAVSPDAAEPDCFDRFGVPAVFEVDLALIEKRYLKLSRALHPDYFTDKSPELQDMSLKLSSLVNEGRRILNDPVLRAEALLARFGGPSATDEKSVPEGFLVDVMEWEEAVQDAKSENAAPAVQALREEFDARRRDALERTASAFKAFREEGSSSALRDARRALNEIRYYDRLTRALE